MTGAALLLVAMFQGLSLDWESLPPLPYRAPPLITEQMQGFVRDEASKHKCPIEGTTLRIDVAVLIDPENGIRTTVPRAVKCPTVERYASALIAGFARGNLLPRSAAGEQWYRASLSFTLAK